MARKPDDDPRRLFDTEFAASVRESAQQIWLAGLGAFAKAQAEGAKAFESLVKEGSDLQQKTREAYGDKLGDVGQRMQSVAGEVTAKAGAQWSKLESMFEDRVARAMDRFDTPTRGDLDALRDRVDELEAKLKAMARRPVAAAKKAPAKRTPRPRAEE